MCIVQLNHLCVPMFSRTTSYSCLAPIVFTWYHYNLIPYIPPCARLAMTPCASVPPTLFPRRQSSALRCLQGELSELLPNKEQFSAQSCQAGGPFVPVVLLRSEAPGPIFPTGAVRCQGSHANPRAPVIPSGPQRSDSLPHRVLIFGERF